VEIKCQLDATDGFFIADLIACLTCFGHHYAHHQELKSIIPWLLPVVFGALVFNLSFWCTALHYAHHQELKNTIQVVAACGVWYFGFQVIGLMQSSTPDR